MAEHQPRSRVDDILEVLDVGLQGDTQQLTQCARCFRREPVEGSDFCAGCRYALLYEDDPASAPPPPANAAPLELDVVLLQPASAGVTGFVPEDAPGFLRDPEPLSPDEVERLTEVVASLQPAMRSLGRESAVLSVTLVQFIPAEFVDVAERLAEVCRDGVALGLELGACEAVVDQELERTHRSLDSVRGVPDRARQKVYQLAGVCSCHLARRCPYHGGGPR